MPMWSLPAEFLDEYRIATSKDVRSWSYGALKSVRKAVAHNWQERRGALHDEAIFGPVRDFECACKRFCGMRYEGMICDVCGVKITTANSRRTRFAHIDFQVPEQHPFGRPTDQIQAFPVIPADFQGTTAGRRLADAYEALMIAGCRQDRPAIREAMDQVIEMLLPIAIGSHAWDLQGSKTLARGLALERLDAFEEIDERCSACGYALAGLIAFSCPGCGRQLDR